MHPLHVVFWVFFASIAAMVGWSFVRMFLDTGPDERNGGGVMDPTVHGAGTDLDTTSGAIGMDHGDSISAYDGGSLETAGLGFEGGEGGGDFSSGGGGDTGGGGDSGGGGGGGW